MIAVYQTFCLFLNRCIDKGELMNILQSLTTNDIWPNFVLSVDFIIGKAVGNISYGSASFNDLGIITKWEDGVLIGLYLDSSSTMSDASFSLDYNRKTSSILKGILGLTLVKQELKIRLYGTPFQLNVWYRLLFIEIGRRTTYKAIAQSLNSKAYRAVGTAIGRNPISILLPCHRVLASNGTLGGYYWGLQRKEYLLKLEEKLYPVSFHEIVKNKDVFER